MQQNEAIKKKQAEAFDTIETWTFRQYYYNMLQYALKKEIILPFIDFTINGRLLFRLVVDEEEQDNETDDDDDDDDEESELEFILKYYGSQESFVKKRTADAVEYYSLNSQDAKKIGTCNLPGFKLVFEDVDTPSLLCFGTSFENISMQNLDKALDYVLVCFKLLQSMDEKKQFDSLQETSVERLFTVTAHDKVGIAYELYEKNVAVEPVRNVEDESDDKTKNLSLEEEWRIVEAKSRANAQLIAKQSIVSSCELHADIWQRNEKLRMTCIGRQYENLATLAKIGDAMHVKFRGADEELQKKICIGELLVTLLPTLVMNC